MLRLISDAGEWSRLKNFWSNTGIEEKIVGLCRIVDDINELVRGDGIIVSKPAAQNIQDFSWQCKSLADYSGGIHQRVCEQVEDEFFEYMKRAADEAYSVKPEALDGIAKADASAINTGSLLRVVDGLGAARSVKCYETLFPDWAKSFDELFKGVKKGKYTDRNILRIKHAAYTAQEPFRSLFFDALSGAKLGRTAPGEKFLSKEPKALTGSYNYFTGRINIDLTKADTDRVIHTFFHEYGHYLDFHHGSISKGLRDVIYNDVHENLREEIGKMTNVQSEAEILLDSLKKGGGELEDPYLNGIRGKLIKNYRKQLSGAKMIVASDVYGGVTNNIIHGDWGHLGAGSQYYWYDIFGRETGGQYREFFAESFGNGVLGKPGIQRNADIYFPNANIEFCNIVGGL